MKTPSWSGHICISTTLITKTHSFSLAANKLFFSFREKENYSKLSVWRNINRIVEGICFDFTHMQTEGDEEPLGDPRVDLSTGGSSLLLDTDQHILWKGNILVLYLHYPSYSAGLDACNWHPGFFVFLRKWSGIASCFSSGDHLEPTVCPADSHLPLSNHPVNHQAFVCTLGAQLASLAEWWAQSRDPPGKW